MLQTCVAASAILEMDKWDENTQIGYINNKKKIFKVGNLSTAESLAIKCIKEVKL